MKRCMSFSCWTSKSVTSRSSKLFAQCARAARGPPARPRRGAAASRRRRAGRAAPWPASRVGLDVASQDRRAGTRRSNGLGRTRVADRLDLGRQDRQAEAVVAAVRKDRMDLRRRRGCPPGARSRRSRGHRGHARHVRDAADARPRSARPGPGPDRRRAARRETRSPSPRRRRGRTAAASASPRRAPPARFPPRPPGRRRGPKARNRTCARRMARQSSVGVRVAPSRTLLPTGSNRSTSCAAPRSPG